MACHVEVSVVSNRSHDSRGEVAVRLGATRKHSIHLLRVRIPQRYFNESKV